jgi:hypothetical protein
MGDFLKVPVPAQKTFKRWKCCQCPICGALRVTEAQKFKCLRCDSSAEYRTEGQEHVKLFDYDTFPEAHRKLLELSLSNRPLHESFIEFRKAK